MKNLFSLIMGLIFIISSTIVSAPAKGGQDSIQHLQWGGIPVRYKEDNRSPLYEIKIYFADGFLSDGKEKKGLTAFMFHHLRSGSNRFKKEEIDNILDYWAVSTQGSVLSEMSFYSVSGLVEHMVPTMKLVCHLFNDTLYPENELQKDRERKISGLENLRASPLALLGRTAREEIYKGTPYALPGDGKISTFKNIKSNDLQKHLQYFREKVRKGIYLAGPKSVLTIKSILEKECGFREREGQYTRTVLPHKYKANLPPLIYFIPVENIAQAQILLGRFLSEEEIARPQLMELLTEFLAGGFSSVLWDELRTKRGYVYGVSARASQGREFGQFIITTQTKVDTAVDTIKTIREVLKQVGDGQFSAEQLERTIKYMSGSFLFGFETNTQYLSQIMFIDHIGRKYEELYQFPQIIRGFKKEDLIDIARKIADPEKLPVFIVAPKKLEEELRSLGTVKVLDYKNYL